MPFFFSVLAVVLGLILIPSKSIESAPFLSPVHLDQTKARTAEAEPSQKQEKDSQEADQQGAKTEPSSEVLELGPAPEAPAKPPPTTEEKTFQWGLEELWTETGPLPSDSSLGSFNYLHSELGVQWDPNPAWTVRLGARVDGYLQMGDRSVDTLRLDLENSFIRFRDTHIRLTVGAQRVIWGRVDGFPPADRMSVRDLRRFILDDLPDRRLVVPALRAEGFFGAYKVELLGVPVFRPAELPNRESIWSPVNPEKGQFIGLEPNPILARLIRQGSFEEKASGAGGIGVRIRRTGQKSDLGLTVQRSRRSNPYYELNPKVLDRLLEGIDLGQAVKGEKTTFRILHPWAWMVGADIAIPAGGITWRLEGAWLSDIPRTTVAPELAVKTDPGLNWVIEAELHPGDANTRVIFQLGGQHLLPDQPVLDRENIYNLSGSIESRLAHDRWRAELRYLVGLSDHNIYINPKMTYLGWEPHTFYLGAHLFDGAEDTPGGFHAEHDFFMLGWRVRY